MKVVSVEDQLTYLKKGLAEVIREEELRQLMVRYQNADPAAVEELISRLSPALLRFLAGPYISQIDLEDLPEEVRASVEIFPVIALGEALAVTLRDTALQNGKLFFGRGAEPEAGTYGGEAAPPI